MVMIVTESEPTFTSISEINKQIICQIKLFLPHFCLPACLPGCLSVSNCLSVCEINQIFAAQVHLSHPFSFIRTLKNCSFHAADVGNLKLRSRQHLIFPLH